MPLMSVRAETVAPSATGAGVLAVAFGTTVAMWTVGYVGRLPAVVLPSPVLLALFLGCLLAGGWFAGRHVRGGWRAGLYVGLLAGTLNLLVLGSLLSGDRPNQIVPAAVLWVPGSILASGLLAAAGGAAGRVPRPTPVAWSSVFARVAILATMLLLAVGGLVTSSQAGLAVVDWPNSYGYNMFLYPLSRMTGGVYYEHAHRLFGALVGLTTLVLALFLQRTERRPFVRRLGWLAFAMVVVQGLLGGLRVTGRFTLSTAPEDMAPSLTLAAVHGVFGQLFFGMLVALGAFTSSTWRSDRVEVERTGAAKDRFWSWALVGTLGVQLVLGAMQRHMQAMLPFHITMAAVVTLLALHVGFRNWALNGAEPLLRRLGVALTVVVAIQVLLGIGAFAAVGGGQGAAVSRTLDLTLTTMHQWCGAILLATSVLVLCWSYRLLSPSTGPATGSR